MENRAVPWEENRWWLYIHLLQEPCWWMWKAQKLHHASKTLSISRILYVFLIDRDRNYTHMIGKREQWLEIAWFCLRDILTASLITAGCENWTSEQCFQLLLLPSWQYGGRGGGIHNSHSCKLVSFWFSSGHRTDMIASWLGCDIKSDLVTLSPDCVRFRQWDWRWDTGHAHLLMLNAQCQTLV